MHDVQSLNALIDAGAAVLDLPIDPAWREAIRTHLDISLRHAKAVASFALPDETEPAPVFRA